MKKIYKKLLVFLPLAIALIDCFVYCIIYYLVLRPKGLEWRPYVTTGSIVIITLGLVIFLILMIYKLLKGLKDQKIYMKIVRLISTAGVGCIIIFVALYGLVVLSLTYTHEKVVKTDDIKYVSCLSDWNPIYYHHYEYDSWFTMADEPFESINR